MSLMDILNVAGLVLGIIGLAYAFYQGTQQRKLEKFVLSQAWYTYAKANNMTGIVQRAFEKYKINHVTNPDPAILELLAKSGRATHSARTFLKKPFVKSSSPNRGLTRHPSIGGLLKESSTAPTSLFSCTGD